MEGFDPRPRQAFGFGEASEVAAVVTEQAVLRACPKESGSILENHLDRQVMEPLVFPVEFEVVALRRSSRAHSQRCNRDNEYPESASAFCEEVPSIYSLRRFGLS